MVSGQSLLGYKNRYTTKVFFSKRLEKVIIPFAFWLCAYTLWKYRHHMLPTSNLYDIIKGMISGEMAMYHLWFFYTLIGIYIMMPFIATIVSNISRKSLNFLILICVINNQVFPLIHKFIGINIGISIPFANPFIDYILLGWVLSQNNLYNNTFYKWIIRILAIIACMMTAVLTYHLTVLKHIEESYFMNYETLTTLVVSIAVYLEVKAIDWNKYVLTKEHQYYLQLFANSTFGIYLIHIFVKYYAMKLFDFSEDSIIFMIIGPVVIYFISFFFVFLLKKVPIIKRLVP